MNPLSAIEDRFDRASDHFETVKQDLRAYYASEPYEARGEYDSGAQQLRTHLKPAPVLTERTFTVVGELLHNLRSALDHLAWQLVRVNMLTPASTDAVNRASRLSYGEATGITQTIRNYSASLGFAILGTILVTQLRSKVTSSLIAQGDIPARAHAEAARIGQTQTAGGSTSTIPHFVRLDFAYASQTVFYVMSAIMATAAVVAFLGLQRGVQPESTESTDELHSQPITPQPTPG